MKKIIIDVMGGDSPEELIKGGILATKMFSDIRIVLAGDKTIITDVANAMKAETGSYDIIESTEVITNDDTPTTAVRSKKQSSMVLGVRQLKEDDDTIGIMSSGSTGALLTSATLIVGRMSGIIRPTTISFLPNQVGGLVAIADCGANVDSSPEQLKQYAIMGSHCYKALCGVDNPVVSLLNVGTEDKKGNALAVASFKQLKEADINFVGNMEARDALKGDVDVIVCDGFDGNILLKGIEGAAKMFSTILKTSIKKSTSAKIGYLFMKGAMKEMKHTLDFNNYGGAPFLGVKKLVMKIHGSSGPVAVLECVKQIIKMHDGDLVGKIQKSMAVVGNEN